MTDAVPPVAAVPPGHTPWDAARVEAVYRALNALLPSLPEFGDRAVSPQEFQRHLFAVQHARQAADRAYVRVTQKLGEQRRHVEILKQNLRLAEVWAAEEPSVLEARSAAGRRRLVEQAVAPERTALALATANLRRLESVLEAVKSTVASLENARITVNSAINLAVAEMKLVRSVV